MTTMAEEIERLGELRTKGLLTEEEFQRAKARLLGGAPVDVPPPAAVNRLRRSRSDKWLGGVCAGIATAVGVESWVMRLLAVILALFGGTGVLLYILLWILVPSE
jgi:phage shock protein C